MTPDIKGLVEDYPDRVHRRREPMRDFWHSLQADGSLREAIPSGIIFLGRRIPLAGFGWAPETWMSSRDEDFPYLMSTVNYKTGLSNDGLFVRYPGYIIWSTKGKWKEIMGSDHLASSFQFSVNRGLHDWYRAEAIDYNNGMISATVNQVVAEIDGKETYPRLALILSRLRPGERPPEIALLVQVYKDQDEADKEARVATPLYYCRVIRRMRVSRWSGLFLYSDRAGSTSILDLYSRFNGAILGEELPETQRWCVDTFVRPEAPRKDQTTLGRLAGSAICNVIYLGNSLIGRVV